MKTIRCSMKAAEANANDIVMEFISDWTPWLKEGWPLASEFSKETHVMITTVFDWIEADAERRLLQFSPQQAKDMIGGQALFLAIQEARKQLKV